MIKVSETALNVLFEGLKASNVESESGLRLKEDSDKLVLEMDTPKKQDRVIIRNGQKVLIFDPEVEASIGDAVIDIEETPEGMEIVLRSK
jgi:outer membrane lipoprotein-sorting protein